MTLDTTTLLPPPTQCDNCGADHVRLATNRDIYGPDAIDPDTTIYRCTVCRASVGCHPGTNAPMGYMADSATRALRVQAHAAFDPLWRTGPLTRKKAYRLLAFELRLKEADCHIALLSAAQLKQVIQFSRDYLSEQRVVERRRDDKRDNKLKERNEREHRERKWRVATSKRNVNRR